MISAMAYVDLNPIRAAIEATPETSDYTSIKLRIEYWKNKANEVNPQVSQDFQPESLLPFTGNHTQPSDRGLAFNRSTTSNLLTGPAERFATTSAVLFLQTLHLFCNGSIFHQNTGSNYPPTLKVDLKALQDRLNPLNSGAQN